MIPSLFNTGNWRLMKVVDGVFMIRKVVGKAIELALRMGKTIELYGFPISVTVSDVRNFVETYTGEGTVSIIKLRHGKGRVPRAYAIIQFTTEDRAKYMISKAKSILGPLRYRSAYLKAREMERDIDPKLVLHDLESVNLYFGCQISKGEFSVLWKKLDVTLTFGTGKRKVQLTFSHNNVRYKLELSYENIWKVELLQPRDKTARYLLIQLLGAPRIFENDVPTSADIYDNPAFNFYQVVPDDHWIRTIDFTPHNCIGQSSAICLEFPSGQNLPNFKDNFAYYEQSKRQYTLQSGVPFSQNWGLVPIVAPGGVEIPFDILFKVNSLVQHVCLAGPVLDDEFYRFVDPSRMPLNFIENALEKLYYSKEFCYEPKKWLFDQYKRYLQSKNHPRPPAISLDTGLVYVRRVQITPCKVYFCGPEINVSNRVLRHFHKHIDNFLRVSFVDEELDRLFSTDLSSRAQNKKTEIYTRILSILQNGIVIGGKKFEFLAFSSSQLRENSLWMFAPTGTGCTAASIRGWMGNFSQIRNVAKYAARLGQSFGSSTETLSVHRDEIEIISDVKKFTYDGKEYVFSDGIGKISLGFAKRVAKKCGYDCTPSAFQIRYGGYKGVVAVDPASRYKLSLRRSMRKYESDNMKLDVLACSKFQPCYLNRQLITLLSTLGIKDGVFQKKQKEAVDQLDTMLTDSLKAQEVLDLMSAGEITNVLKEMLICGYKPNNEPFLSMMLKTFRASKLLELRLKSRIIIPKGRAMMGCLDETKNLEYGQVFVQFSNSRLRDSDDSFSYNLPKNYMVTGKVVVAKNPCLHPGDVRILQAVDVPDLYHMVDCVVFPQKGPRPHPNECSGSDLDGDIYFVCWDPELIPSHQIEPMDYTPAPTTELDHDVRIEEVEEYFTNYIVNDSLGIIANAHTVFADKEAAKAMSGPCIELAKLFSTAVDFPKTGVPAVIPPHLYVKEYPDFMEKPDKLTYVSRNVIGKLFREVQEISSSAGGSITSFTRDVAVNSYDPDMEFDGFEDYVDDACYHKSNYDYKLGNLMDYYGIKTEAEILSGNIMKMSKSFNKRRDSEAINMAVRSLRKEARSWFNEGSSGVDFENSDDKYAKASAWYHVTYHPSYWGCYNEGMIRDHFLSFPWCVYPQLVQIKKEKVSNRMYSREFSLSGLRLN
ncbi:unnamed protein product [Sphenostylis stenocarpa]|uniref:RNA-dependent RNA polymerase n=1 Tax=Sphenostylis stenocarpa TaxID=92480 RepID=A0AA86SKV4_9FABA|nr:unnamed protein product [Sphenostylis stenocarpa]